MNRFCKFILLGCTLCETLTAQTPEAFNAAHPVSSNLPGSAPYIYPGVMVEKNGIWNGYDNLLYVGNQFSIDVNVIGPEGYDFPVAEEILYNRLSSILGSVGITSQRAKGFQKPQLPMFSLVILTYPLEQGNTAYIGGRLIEEVTLKRLPLDKEALYQAITWEQKNLIVSDKGKFIDTVVQTVDQIVKSFADRYSFFTSHEEGSNIKPESQAPKINLKERLHEGEQLKKEKKNKPIVPFENNPPFTPGSGSQQPGI